MRHISGFKPRTAVLLALLASVCGADQPEPVPSPAPTADRVGFPTSYRARFEVLRVFTKSQEAKVVTIYGNTSATSVTNLAQLPYPYGSVIVMETASALKDAEGKPLLDDQANLRKGKITGLHVMRRERTFGEAYGKNRAGEWEFVEYRPDGSYITPPEKTGTCAACHLKAGANRDFVYRGRPPADAGK